jgi:hypothetical protein
MARHLLCHSMVKSTDRRAPIDQKNASQLSSLLEGDDTEIFEIDRSNLVLQLRTVRRAIKEGAEEIEMVAIERVFAKAVSRVLTRTALKLNLVAKDLDGLLPLIERAQVPKAPGRPKPKRKAGNRPKAPD